MNTRSGLKILAIFALFLNIGACIFLFGSIKNSSTGVNHSNLFSLLSVVSIIVFSFLLFLLFMITRANEPDLDEQSGPGADKSEEEDSSAPDVSAEINH